ncbi:VCBS repeat domain-containing M23 family metallopeptidase [Polymorphospora rubra]|uniref:M23ase beta-sheet core domain-containing protein n=1 Tax=Polymorphospora rubra TaxID=338584 RepID=A0A810MT43_9ACTN|nr:VCBS repeat domain-containing M23 family metallopeptidase [Polymorphospora rubra]BCJ63670.1 hypothetical protein Prubr_06910 [Polymorphospora rubra]
MSIFRKACLVAGAVLLAATGALVAQPAVAAGPRPVFQLPVGCGETWDLRTYAGHDYYDIDFWPTSGPAWGQPIRASFAGTVAFAGIGGTLGGRTPSNPNGPIGTGAGYYVKIDHGDGWETLYLHMLEPPMVSTGQVVYQGQQLGKVGSTGDSSGPHLHYEQLRDGAKIESYFDEVASGITHDNYGYSVQRRSRNCGGWTQFADMNADRLADLVQIRTNGDVVVYWNVGGTFTGSNALVATGFKNAARVRFADMNADGRADLVQLRVTGQVVVYWNVDGIFTGSNTVVASGAWDPERVHFADMNNDRVADLLDVRESGQVVVYWNVGGTFTGSNAQVATGFTDPLRVKFADMNNDGRAELVQVRDTGQVVVYWNVGGTFTGSNALVATGFTDPMRVKFADMNSNGVADLVDMRPNGDVVVYWNVDGTFTGSNALVAEGFKAP